MLIEKKEQLRFLKKNKSELNIAIIIMMTILLLVVAVCTVEMKWGKAQLIIDTICIIVTLGLLIVYMTFNLKIELFSFFCIILLGGMSAIVQPILNIPDEAAHFARAERVSEGKMFADPSMQKFATIKSVVEMQELVEIPITKSTLEGEKIDYTVEYVDHVAASNLSFLYFPQAFGIMIAKVLGMHAVWLLWLARICNLLFYACLIMFAIHITPCLKYLFLFVSILPMTIQQAASCSVDAMINGVTIFYMAFFLYLYNKKNINKKEMCVFYCLSILLPLTKVTNLCIAGLTILLPLDSSKGKTKRCLIKVAGVMGICIVAITYYLYTMSLAPNLGQLDYVTQMNVNGGEQLNYIFNNFTHWVRTFIASMINQIYTSVVQLSTFGWLSYGYPILIVILPFLFGKLCFQEKGVAFSKIEKILILLMILGTYSLTCLALYIGWTPVGSESLEGVQGRYFIPLIALGGIALTSEKNKEENKNHIFDVVLMLLMTASMIIVTSNHYYA